MKHGNIVRQPGKDNKWNEFIDYGEHEIVRVYIETPLSKLSDRHYSGPYCKLCNQILTEKENL